MTIRSTIGQSHRTKRGKKYEGGGPWDKRNTIIFLSFLFLMVLSRIPAEWYCDAFFI